jgi:hypothetical protein
VAYDEELTARVRAVLPRGEAVTERRMFGGLAFMLGGYMFRGVVTDTLMVLLGLEAAGRAGDPAAAQGRKPRAGRHGMAARRPGLAPSAAVTRPDALDCFRGRYPPRRSGLSGTVCG